MTHTPFLLGQATGHLSAGESADQADTTETVRYEVAQALPIQASQNTAQVGAVLGGSALVLGLIGVGALMIVLKTCLRICNPNQILIISGR